MSSKKTTATESMDVVQLPLVPPLQSMAVLMQSLARNCYISRVDRSVRCLEKCVHLAYTRVHALHDLCHRHGNAMALPWTGVALPWHFHGNATAIPWHCRMAIAMAMPCQCHGITVALPWQCHAMDMGMGMDMDMDMSMDMEFYRDMDSPSTCTHAQTILTHQIQSTCTNHIDPSFVLPQISSPLLTGPWK